MEQLNIADAEMDTLTRGAWIRYRSRPAAPEPSFDTLAARLLGLDDKEIAALHKPMVDVLVTALVCAGDFDLDAACKALIANWPIALTSGCDVPVLAAPLPLPPQED